MDSYKSIAGLWGLKAEHAVWEATFEESTPWAENIARWLSSPEALRAAAAEGALTEEMTEWLVCESAPLVACPAWCRLVAHLHYLLIVRSVRVAVAPEEMPMLPKELGVAADLFYLHVYLSGLSTVRARHEEKGIPPEVTAGTLSDLRTRVQAYRNTHGRWGLNNSTWLQHYPRLTLFTLGRLQFAFHRFLLPFKVYTHRATGEVAILPVAGERVRLDGQFASADEGVPTPGDWETTLEEEGASTVGHRVDTRRGVICQEKVALPRAEWDEAMRPGDAVLAIHIPADGPLHLEGCLNGLRQVESFFSRYYPAFPFTGVTCATWLLDPQFAEHAGPEANIVRFQKLFHAYPVPDANDRQMYDRLFNTAPVPVEALPGDTRLRRAVISHMKAGGRWRLGAGAIPRSALPK